MSATMPPPRDANQAIDTQQETRPAPPQDLMNFTVRFTDTSGHLVQFVVLAGNPSQALWLAISDRRVQRRIESMLATISYELNVTVVRT